MDFWNFVLWFFWIYLVVTCVWIFIWIVMDIFRDHTLNGWTKALWVVFLVILPFLGALIYLIARGRSIAQRNAQEAQRSDQAAAEYIRSVTESASPAAEIEKAQGLLASGAITQADFDTIKAKALA